MSNFQRKVAQLWRETRGNIAVELLKYLGGSSVLSAVWKAISQAVQHSSVDWLLFGGLVLFGVVLIVVAFVVSRGKESALEPRDATSPTVPRQPDVAQAQKLKILSAVYGPYKGEGAIDVTEVLRGLLTSDTLAVMVNNDLFGDPAIGRAKRLQVSYSYGSPAVVKIERRESDLMVLPEDTFLKEQAEKPLGSVLSSLQIECIELARELKQFLSEMPPPDNDVFEISRHSRDVFDWATRVSQRPQQMEAWSNKLGHAYASRFSLKVTALIHQLGAEGIDVSQLEPYQKLVGSDDNVNAAICALRQLCFELADRDET